MHWMDEELADRKKQGLLRVRPSFESAQGIHVRCAGRDYLNFASNDYLNLAADRRVTRAAARTAKRYGCGAGASPLVAGCLRPHRLLERDVARWEGTEAALVFSSGFAANLAAMTALVSAEDAVFSDALNHASIIDGCRLSRARVHVYQHGDANHLESLLCRHAGSARRRLIVTDTIFSMEGDLAPVAELAELSRRFDCFLLVDEAHATGVLGDRGRGVTELLSARTQLDPDTTVKVGTLSKALGSQGGFVCGSRSLIKWLVNHARPYIFSTALAPPAAGAARAALAIIEAEPEQRLRLRQLAAFFRDQLRALGLEASRSQSQIVPIVVGEAHTASRFAGRLRRKGLLVPAIRPPSVPQGSARLRVSLTAGHTEDDVLRLVSALQDNRGDLTGNACHAERSRGHRLP